VHISELAQHHVENPREIIQPGDPVRVKILEIDSERRRLSLSIKRVEGQVLPVRPIQPPEGESGSLDDVPELGLSEDVFGGDGAGAVGIEPEPGDASSELGDPESTAVIADTESEVAATDAEAPAADAEAPAADAEAPAIDTEAPAIDTEVPAPETEAADQPEAAVEPEAVAAAEPEAVADVEPETVAPAEPDDAEDPGSVVSSQPGPPSA
jgi:small subunit ribosomal protein S1